MQILKNTMTACFMAIMLSGTAHGETLAIIDSMIVSGHNADFLFDSVNGFYINGLYIADTAVYATCDKGIIAKYRGEERWRLVAGRDEYLAAREVNMTAAGEYNRFHPSKIWEMPSGELGIYDSWLISNFYFLNPAAPPKHRLHPLKYPDEKSIVVRFNLGKDILLCGLYSIYHNRMIGIMNPDLSEYHRIFDIPVKLRHDLDSMGADYYPLAAFNPIDSAIWVAFENYNMLYIVNKQGDLLDSVRITHPDFVLPQPPASRIKSWAVFNDWSSKCASISSLQFVPPGYFLLKYFGPRKNKEDPSSRPQHLLCWNSKGEPVDLAINPEWQLTQVQADGTIPFVAYEREGGVMKKAIIYLTRIMP